MFDVMVDRRSMRPLLERTISADGADEEELFVNFLREALYLFHGEGLLLADCRVTEFSPRFVAALVRGEPFDPQRHAVKTEIKAVTYHGAVLEQRPEGWSGKVIFDV
jgi:SHS2 domain-containing protein